MISRYTLEITGLRIPPEILDRQLVWFHTILVYSTICATLGFITELGYGLVYLQVNELYFRIFLNIAVILVLILGCVISVRFRISFPGFSALIACIGAAIKLEEIVLVFDLVSDAIVSYSL